MQELEPRLSGAPQRSQLPLAETAGDVTERMRGSPQLKQYFASGRTLVPHEGQILTETAARSCTDTGEPQLRQNFFDTSAPHLGHFIAALMSVSYCGS